MSKPKHLAGLQKVSIHWLHNWLPNQEEWWEPPKWRLSPGGRALSGKRKDGGMEGDRRRHGKEEQSPSSSRFPSLPALMVSNYLRLPPPAMSSSGHKVFYHLQEQALREAQSCWRKAVQVPHWAPVDPGADPAQDWGAGTSSVSGA